MKGSVRFTLATALLMLSHSIGGNVIDITSRIPQDEYSCRLFEPTSDMNSNSSFKTRSLGYDRSSQSLSIPDVELGFKSVTETSSNNYRPRRTTESNDLFKDVMYKFFLLRENSLMLDRSKSHYSDKDLHYSIICSDYYALALRRILI